MTLDDLRLNIESQLCSAMVEVDVFARNGLSYPAEDLVHFTRLIMEHVKAYLAELPGIGKAQEWPA